MRKVIANLVVLLCDGVGAVPEREMFIVPLGLYIFTLVMENCVLFFKKKNNIYNQTRRIKKQENSLY